MIIITAVSRLRKISLKNAIALILNEIEYFNFKSKDLGLLNDIKLQIEITKTTDNFIDIIKTFQEKNIEVIVGTILNSKELKEVYNLGIKKIVSPIFSEEILIELKKYPTLNYCPGISTKEELKIFEKCDLNQISELKVFPIFCKNENDFISILKKPFEELINKKNIALSYNPHSLINTPVKFYSEIISCKESSTIFLGNPICGKGLNSLKEIEEEKKQLQMSSIQLTPFGGVNVSNIEELITAGYNSFGLSSILNQEILDEAESTNCKNISKAYLEIDKILNCIKKLKDK